MPIANSTVTGRHFRALRKQAIARAAKTARTGADRSGTTFKLCKIVYIGIGRTVRLRTDRTAEHVCVTLAPVSGDGIAKQHVRILCPTASIPVQTSASAFGWPAISFRTSFESATDHKFDGTGVRNAGDGAARVEVNRRSCCETADIAACVDGRGQADRTPRQRLTANIDTARLLVDEGIVS